tara:strand:+ start:277 stop:513 length:237 start_codon:yes stop_codon:yes gene_type:complete
MNLSKFRVIPTTPTKRGKLDRLKQIITKSAKFSNPAYLNAIERNKKKSLYNQMILKLRAEIHPSKKEQIIAEYIRSQD